MLVNCSFRLEKINEVVRNTELNTLKTKVNHLEKKISDATTVIHIDLYNGAKQN